jgi:formamidopyrimidine-DNA glycosylase
MLEVERYRRLAEGVVGRTVAVVDAPDRWFLKDGLDAAALNAALVGAVVAGTGRRGKLAWLDLHGAPGGVRRLGLRFGMTGRLLVDGVAGLDDLVYGSSRDEPAWDRFALRFEEGGHLVVRDPRRLGGVMVDPDLTALGPDAWTLTAAQLAAGLGRSEVALKARLLDQRRIAGLGNLLVDEILWRSGLSPLRSAASMSGGASHGDGEEATIRQLASVVRATVRRLDRLGGSHCGALQSRRDAGGGPCPRDGAPLRRSSVAGRTTWWCPRHQR